MKFECPLSCYSQQSTLASVHLKGKNRGKETDTREDHCCLNENSAIGDACGGGLPGQNTNSAGLLFSPVIAFAKTVPWAVGAAERAGAAECTDSLQQKQMKEHSQLLLQLKIIGGLKPRIVCMRMMMLLLLLVVMPWVDEGLRLPVSL